MRMQTWQSSPPRAFSWELNVTLVPADRLPCRLRVRRRCRVRADDPDDGARWWHSRSWTGWIFRTACPVDDLRRWLVHLQLVLHQRPASVVGVDPSPSQLSFARQGGRRGLLHGRGRPGVTAAGIGRRRGDGPGALLRARPAARCARTGTGGQVGRDDCHLSMGSGRRRIPAASRSSMLFARQATVAAAARARGRRSFAGIGRSLAMRRPGGVQTRQFGCTVLLALMTIGARPAESRAQAVRDTFAV